jgi:hypothetical protein
VTPTLDGPFARDRDEEPNPFNFDSFCWQFSNRRVGLAIKRLGGKGKPSSARHFLFHGLRVLLSLYRNLPAVSF